MASKTKTIHRTAVRSNLVTGLSDGSAAGFTSERVAVQSVERLLGIVARLLGCRTALLLFNSNGVSRLVAAHGVGGSKLVSYSWTYEGAPYRPEERFILADASTLPQLKRAFGFLQFEQIGFFFRTPVQVSDAHTLTLIALDPAPGQLPNKKTLACVDETIGLFDEEFRDLSQLMGDPQADMTLPLALSDLTDKNSVDPEPAFILNSDLKIVHANDAARKLMLLPAHKIIRSNATAFVPPTNDGIIHFLKRALVERLSTPVCEIIIECGSSRERCVYWMMASPFSPTGSNQTFLLVNVRELTQKFQREDEIERRALDSSPPARVDQPTIDFLLDTLPRRQALRNRNTMSYVTVRSWRQPVREFQLKALKALKQHCPADLAKHIGPEIVDSITSLVGRTAFKAIVPVPCGHSKASSCLSVEIARAVGQLLQLPVVHAFETQKLSGSSHPRKNSSRPPLILVNPPLEPILLVDDVATSGTQLERAVTLLRPLCGAVLPIAWIGGDAAKG